MCGVHVSNPSAEVFLKDGSLYDGPDDEAFLVSLRRSLKTARGAYPPVFFLLYAAWVRSRAERPSVSYTKVVSKVARTGHNLHLQRRIKQQNCGSNKFLHRGDGKMKRMLEPSIKLIGEVHRMSG